MPPTSVGGRPLVSTLYFTASRGGRVDSGSTYYTGGLPIESQQPTSVTNVACRECDQPPCCIHTYTVYTPIGGKGRCRTSCDLQDHRTASKKECRRDIHSGFETHEEGHTKSKTGAISGSTKWTLVQTKNLKKNKQTSTLYINATTPPPHASHICGWAPFGKYTVH